MRMEDLISPKIRLSDKDLFMRANIQGGALTFINWPWHADMLQILLRSIRVCESLSRQSNGQQN
jgi:hypothetical protein